MEEKEKIDFIKFNCYDTQTGDIYPCIINRYSIIDAYLYKNYEIKYWDAKKSESVHVKFIDCVVINLRKGAGSYFTHHLAEDINNVIDILGAGICS